MRRLPVPRSVLPVLACCVLSACGDEGPAAPPDPDPWTTEIRIAEDEIILLVPGSAALEAVVLDHAGRVVSGAIPVWMSREPATASVDRDGVVTAVETGDTWIVATSPGSADSVRVRVRYPVEPGLARARVRKSGADDVDHLVAVGNLYDLVGTDERDRIAFFMEGSDTRLVILASTLDEGVRVPLQAWSIDQLMDGATIFDVATPGAVYSDLSDDQRPVWHVGESGYLEVTEIRPPASEEDTGFMRGHISFRAVGYELTGVDGEPPSARATGDTLRLDVDFHASFTGEEVGWAEVRFEGGPIATEGELWDAEVEWPNVNPAGAPLVDLRMRGRADLSLIVFSPEPGTLTVYEQDPDGTFGAGNGRTSLRIFGNYPFFMASGQGGTLELSSVTWPDDPASGTVVGTLEASALYWIGGNPENAQVGTVSAEFGATWPPRPSTAPPPGVREGRSPWTPLIQLAGPPAVRRGPRNPGG